MIRKKSAADSLAIRLSIFAAIVTFILTTLSILLGPLVAPFVVSALVAYLLCPVVDRLERLKIPRILSLFFIFAVLTIVLVVVSIQLVPFAIEQIQNLIISLPRLFRLAWAWGVDLAHGLLHRFGVENTTDFDKAIASSDLFSHMINRWQSAAMGLVLTGSSVASFLFHAVLVPIIAFFLVLEKKRLKKYLWFLIPQDLKPMVGGLLSTCDSRLRAVIKGQINVAMVMSLLYAIAFAIIGVPGAFTFGLLTGLCRLVPYVDPPVATLLGGASIFTRGGSGTDFFLLIGLIIVIQTIDGVILTPRLIGGRVGIHPVVVILSVATCGYWFGFLGVLLAIPIVAVLKALLELVLPIYLKSSWFSSSNDPAV